MKKPFYIVNWHIDNIGTKYPEDGVTWQYTAELSPEELKELKEGIDSRYGQSLSFNQSVIMSFETLKVLMGL